MKTDHYPRGCALMECGHWDEDELVCLYDDECIYNDHGCKKETMVADGCRSRVVALETESAGKALVDLEKLREIEWEPFTHTAVSCPVCKLVFVHTDKQRHHMPDCWIAALLKDAP